MRHLLDDMHLLHNVYNWFWVDPTLILLLRGLGLCFIFNLGRLWVRLLRGLLLGRCFLFILLLFLLLFFLGFDLHFRILSLSLLG